MSSPRPYGGYSSPSFPDTPIYDSLVAERGTPQIAPIRVPSPYEPLGYSSASAQPALPALPALPAAPTPSPGPATGHVAHQAAPVRQPLPGPSPQGHSPYGSQQGGAPRPYPAPAPHATQAYGTQHMRPAAPRPAAPRPAAPRQVPGGYQNPYPTGQQQQPYPGTGYWSEQGSGQQGY
jgi:hypothetical protein